MGSRRTTPEGDRLLQLLLDRRWHSHAEILTEIGELVTPEKAEHLWSNDAGHNKNRRDRHDSNGDALPHPDDVERSTRVVLGRKRHIGNLLSSWVSDGRLERKETDTGLEYRLDRAWCWNCGVCIRMSVQAHPVCDGCAQKLLGGGSWWPRIREDDTAMETA